MSTIIKETESWQRIDKFLTTQFPYSRNFFHHIIERGGVTIRNKSVKVKKSYKLKPGDAIVIDNMERYLDGGILEEAAYIDIPIVKEEEDYLVINKPKGVLSHPNSIRDMSHPSVVGRLYHHYKELPSIGNFIRAWLVHRLDKETDGLMIIAKTEKGLAHFKSLFQTKSTAQSIEEKEAVPLKKFYQATSYITPEWQIFLEKIKDKLPYTIIADVIPKTPHPIVKKGITKILSIESLKEKKSDKNNHQESTRMNIEILTGRTHQIRYHLSSNGLPIIGDYLYGTEEETAMQLSAKKLIFKDPRGEIQTVEK